jgi:Fis family transcriptional regulator, factor for inversion stimulation protein
MLRLTNQEFFLQGELKMSTMVSHYSVAGTIPQAEAASLSESVLAALQSYFEALNGQEPVGLYKMVLEEAEPPMLQIVMEQSRFNQSRAAEVLGISRGTLRQKLRKYFGDKYVGTRED